MKSDTTIDIEFVLWDHSIMESKNKGRKLGVPFNKNSFLSLVDDTVYSLSPE